MGARPRFHSSLAPGQGLTHSRTHTHTYTCVSKPVRCNACKPAQLCIFPRVHAQWWSLPIPGRVCSGLTPVHQTTVPEPGAHLSPCVCTASTPPPSPDLQSPGENALRPLAQRLGSDCSRPGLSHPNPASHTLSQACDLTFRGRSWPSVLISYLSAQLSRLFPP